MSNKQDRLDEINKQLEGLEKVSEKTSEIIAHGNAVIKNNIIEDKDDSISAIKRIEEILEAAISDAATYARDSDQPKIYDSVAKLIKEFGALQTTKMNIHKVHSTESDPTKKEGEDINDKNQVGSLTSIKDVLSRVKKEREEEEDGKSDDV